MKKVYIDVTEEVTWEPLVKSKYSEDPVLFMRLFHGGKLIATMNCFGEIQRQINGHLVFWERGNFRVLKFDMFVGEKG